MTLDMNSECDETNRIIEKYSVLSRHICCMCGKPDVKIITKGWVYPCCRECFEADKTHLLYGEVTSDKDDGRMPDTYEISRWSDGEYETIEIDIKETADRIRETWEEA